MQRVSAREAHALMEQGYVYLDVRTAPEFAEGHPRGAYNVPWVVPAAQGMVHNPAFVQQVEHALGREARIVVGCATGVRSLEAAQQLAASGFLHVCEQRAGMLGVRDPFGRTRERGWRDEGLPLDTTPEPMRSHEEIARASGT
jgi:rhodanese-related sulfurtransferase